jgi:hypothetical protein
MNKLPNGWTRDTVFTDLAILIGLVENQWPIAFVNAPSLCGVPALSNLFRDKRVKVVLMCDPDEHILPESKVRCVRFSVTHGESPFAKSAVEATRKKALTALSEFWDELSHEYAGSQKNESPVEKVLSVPIGDDNLLDLTIIAPAAAPAPPNDEEPAMAFVEPPDEMPDNSASAYTAVVTPIPSKPAAVPIIHKLMCVDETKRIIASNEAITIICPVSDGALPGTRMLGEWSAYYPHNFIGILDQETGQQVRANDLNVVCARLTQILGIQIVAENMKQAVCAEAESVPA